MAQELAVQAAGLSPPGPAVRRRDWPEAAVRGAFGVAWAIDAFLKWQPGFRTGFLASLQATAAGQPHWLAPWFSFWVRLEGHAPWLWADAGAATETIIALAVLLGVARKLVYIGGAGYAVLVWSTAGGFGGPYGPGATDIGPAIMYALVFCALLGLGGLTGRYCLDTLISRRMAWWWRVAGRAAGADLPGTAQNESSR